MNLVVGDVFHRVEDTSIFVMGQKDPLNLYGAVLSHFLWRCSLDVGSLSTLVFGPLLWATCLLTAFYLVGATALCVSSKGVLKRLLNSQTRSLRNSGASSLHFPLVC